MSTEPPLSALVSPLGPPPRFLADANFNHRIVIGLRRLAPNADVITAQEIGLAQLPDPDLLAEALRLDRILLTHDINTIPMHFDAFLQTLLAGEHSPGVLLVAQGLAIGIAVQELYEIWSCSAHEEWRDQRVFVPL